MVSGNRLGIYVLSMRIIANDRKHKLCARHSIQHGVRSFCSAGVVDGGALGKTSAIDYTNNLLTHRINLLPTD